MTRPVAAMLVVLAMVATGCSTLGLGEVECTPPDRNITSSNILTLQAVPTARYTPCLKELRLGWDEVLWFARDGEAGLEVFESASAFLTATVTAACEIGDAIQVPSGHPDIDRFEAVETAPVEIGITIVPEGEATRFAALRLLDEFDGTELDGRPIDMDIDDDQGSPVPSRVERALAADRHVWVISELAAEEGRVEVRSNNRAITGSGITPDDALDLIEDHTPELFYRGHWFFTFDGGCITYEFDAKGTIAETVAADADDAFGFYPAYRLRQMAEDAGFDIVEDGGNG